MVNLPLLYARKIYNFQDLSLLFYFQDELDSVIKEKSPGPLSTEEEMAKETRVPITMDTSGACLNSLHMPLVEEAKNGLEKFGSKLVNYLRFSIGKN